MNRSSIAGIGLFLVATLAIPVTPRTAVPPNPGGDEALSKSDHDALGKVLAGFLEASDKNKDIDKARNAVASEIEKFAKRLKKDPLSLTVDLGKSLWESLKYESAKGVKKGKVAEVKYANKDLGMDFTYASWVPPKYEAKNAYSLILCIPDKGERPMDHLTEKWTSQEIRENVILAAVPMPDDAALWGEVGSQGKWGGVANLLAVFRDMNHTYATDFDRVYVAGRGVGVAAAMAIAARNPDRFAGVIGRTGDPNEMPCENFRNLPSFFAGGGAGATAFADKCTKAGYENCTIKPEGTEQDVFAWIKDHPRISNPSQVVLLPTLSASSPPPSKVYWLEIPTWDGQGKAIVHGTIDRASNTVTIDGEGITKVFLFFNDLLVDLDKPVKVVCNGAEHTDQIPRSLGTTLDLILKGRSDPGKLYVATKDYDLPAKPKAK